MLCVTASFSKVSQKVFGDDVLRLCLETVKDDVQHDFVSVADGADCSQVLALLLVSFYRKPSTVSVELATPLSARSCCRL